jgi:ABC-type multidrug transport system fused ATPase/permease subunit
MVWEDSGLLPAVWRDRDRAWGPLLAWSYRRLAWLRDNASAVSLLFVVGLLLAGLHAWIESRLNRYRLQTALDVASRLRIQLHRQALRLGPGDLTGKEMEQVSELFTHQVDRIRDGLRDWMAAFQRAPVELALLLGFLVLLDPRLAVQTLLPLALVWWLLQRDRERTRRVKQQAAARSQQELRLLSEGLELTRLVRSYSLEDFARNGFAGHVARFQQTVRGLLHVDDWTAWVYRALEGSTVALVVYLIATKVGPPPRGISFASALLYVVVLIRLAKVWTELMQGHVSSDAASDAVGRVERYLERTPSVSQAVGAKFLPPLSRMLAFEDVTYAAPDGRLLLDGFSVKIPAGRRAALVSTEPLSVLAAAMMLPRFIEPQSGRITVDGEDLNWVTLESLRAEALFVGGKDRPFTGTVLENIRIGDAARSAHDATEAAKLVHAHQFILGLPQGFETLLGERGDRLSPGQEFRLNLARAALRDPALLIIEEPDEPLDDDTKMSLDDAYVRLCEGRTTLFLARRLSTLKKADEIVFVHKGKVEAIGPHAQLVQGSPLYRHWEYLHFNVFRKEIDPTRPA